MSHRSIRVPTELEERIVYQAAAEERSFSAMAVILMRRGLDGSYPAPPPDLAISETPDELGEKVVKVPWPEAGTNVAYKRDPSKMCPHRVPAGSFCKRCGA